jgi:hypothetical protein
MMGREGMLYVTQQFTFLRFGGIDEVQKTRTRSKSWSDTRNETKHLTWNEATERTSFLDLAMVHGSQLGLAEPDCQRMSEQTPAVTSSECGAADGSRLFKSSITLEEHGEMWSKGSEMHPVDCTPCAFYCFKRSGCEKGESCNFCHMGHESRRRRRRVERKRRLQEDTRLDRGAVAATETRRVGTSAVADCLQPVSGKKVSCPYFANQEDLPHKSTQKHISEQTMHSFPHHCDRTSVENFERTLAPEEAGALVAECVPDQHRRLIQENLQKFQSDNILSDQSTVDSMYTPDAAELFTAHNKLQAPAPGTFRSFGQHGEMWSKGSESHPGNCTPCAFFCFKRSGCDKGESCNFCHLGHESRRQRRREERMRVQQSNRQRRKV